MRVLVTGAAGLLGRALLRTLEQHRVETVALDCQPPPPDWKGHWVQADIRAASEVRAAAAGCEVVFHLAAVLPQHRRARDEMHAVNVSGTRNALAAAQASGAQRVVFVSSTEVYGIPERCPCDEDAPLRPVGAYGQQKVEAELWTWRLAAEAGMAAVVLRPCTIVGKNASPGALRPLLLVFRAMRRGWPLPLIGGGHHRVSFVAAEDVAEVCWRAAQQKSRAGCFNVATAVPPLRELFGEVAKRLGFQPRFWEVPAAASRLALGLGSVLGAVPVEPEHRALLQRDYAFATARAEAELGFRPRPPVEALVSMAREWEALGLLEP